MVVLGDQLCEDIAALAAADRSRDIVLMMEVAEETTYVRHHRKKVVLVLAAMRHFANVLRDDGWQVDYVGLTDEANTGSFAGEIERAVQRHAPKRILVTHPGEWRVRESLRSLGERLETPLDMLADTRFLCTIEDFAKWADGRKTLRMEHFYREMRRRTGLLMDGNEPAGGQWNFDSQNRKPPKDALDPPEPLAFEPDAVTQEVIELVEERFGDHFGTVHPFRFPVTAEQARAAMEDFLDHRLVKFGDYQDAMVGGECFLFHSLLSAALNLGLLDPLDLCRRVEARYREGAVPINAAEGFIRQIIGWREFVRGIYWTRMPGYLAANALDAKRDLPWFYWTAETDMACMRAALEQTRDEAYAHHIQRLMITGNFALLAGINPVQVHEWYLAVYFDAFEWVEAPNTIGMSQFADGGVIASKPYAAGGNYISKMSDHCRDCTYIVSRKTGEGACPFNYLYWDFIARNESQFGDNPRMGQIYRLWNSMDADKRRQYRDDAKRFLDAL